AADVSAHWDAAQRGGAEISQREEGAAAVRRHRRVAIYRSEELPLDDGVQPQLPDRGTYLRAIYSEELPERQDRRPLSERRPRQGLSDRPEGWAGRQGQDDDRGRNVLRIVGPDDRLADRPAEIGGRRCLLRCIDTQICRTGHQEGCRSRLETVAYPRHQRDVGRRRDETCGTGKFQERHQRELWQGSARSDVEERRRPEKVFRLHGEILS